MLLKINDLLAGITMTIIGGICLLISLIGMLTNIRMILDPAWLSVVICGIPLLYLAVSRIIYNPGMKKVSSALLISIAMFAAIGIGDIFAAGEVAFIMAIGAILEDKTAERAKKGLKKLIHLSPQTGRRIAGEKEEVVDIDAIRAGDILRIVPGELVPVDGTIIEGNTSIDQSVITGESLPVDKMAGDEVFCGTMNRFGTVDIKALKVGEDSSLQKLIRMVEEAENKKAPLERIADKWAAWLVPIALLIAIAAGMITGDIVRAVTVLVVFCPCALVLATPTVVMAAIGQATKHGVIIKSGEALERMGKVDCITFDKTGTLTYGNLLVSDVISFDPLLDNSKVLKVTASVESFSEHPLAKAIILEEKEKQIELEDVKDFSMIPGKGVQAVYNNQEVLCGNVRWLEERGIEFQQDIKDALMKLRKQGKALIITALENRVIGILALSDNLRENADAIITELKQTHTDVVLLTGDHSQTAEYFANQVGISTIHAELLPKQKVKEIQNLEKEGKIVCMIGDGVNDAPALKTAYVGIAMGTMGSDIAVDAADIALMGDDISKVPYLKRLSKAAVRTIKLSIGLSLCINLIAILLSITGVLTPTTGALVHNAGSIFVVLIAALLYDRKFINAENE